VSHGARLETGFPTVVVQLQPTNSNGKVIAEGVEMQRVLWLMGEEMMRCLTRIEVAGTPDEDESFK
jgi:hypothetical protein